MSVVVAIRDKDRIWMGCDSQVTIGYNKETLKTEKKMWKPEDNDNVLMGLVGDLRDGNILSIQEDWVDEMTIMKDTFGFRYMVEDVVPNIFDVLNKHGRLRIKDNMKFIEPNVLFAFNEQCFAVYDDGCVIEMNDMIAIGSGRVLSAGAYNAVKDRDISVKEKLIEAVKAACDGDLYVNYPIIIMNTKDNEVISIER